MGDLHTRTASKAAGIHNILRANVGFRRLPRRIDYVVWNRKTSVYVWAWATKRKLELLLEKKRVHSTEVYFLFYCTKYERYRSSIYSKGWETPETCQKHKYC